MRKQRGKARNDSAGKEYRRAAYGCLKGAQGKGPGKEGRSDGETWPGARQDYVPYPQDTHHMNVVDACKTVRFVSRAKAQTDFCQHKLPDSLDRSVLSHLTWGPAGPCIYPSPSVALRFRRRPSSSSHSASSQLWNTLSLPEPGPVSDPLLWS
ncbi:hypothetical protein VUR80DRAFT_5226 [Thermomyces stellatus]